MRYLAVVILFTFFANVAYSANFKIIERDDYDLERFPIPDPYGNIPKRIEVHLSGEIIKGDANKLTNLLHKHGISGEYLPEDGLILSLNSKGGSFSEGIELSKIVKKFNLVTLIKKNSECLSACAVVFMAGEEILAEAPPKIARYLEVPATLGFHRPSLSLDTATLPKDLLKEISPEMLVAVINEKIEDSYNIATQQIQEMMAVDPTAWDTGLIVDMLLKKGRDFIVLSKVSEALSWRINIFNIKARYKNVADTQKLYPWLCFNSIPYTTAYGNGWVLAHVDKATDRSLEWDLEIWLREKNEKLQQINMKSYFVIMEQLNATGCEVIVNKTENTVIVDSKEYDFNDGLNNIFAYPHYTDINAIAEP